MPRAGHVQIDGRDYKVADETAIRRYTPNPLQASGNTGGAYGDLIGMDVDQFVDYAAGLGRRDSTGGGFDYATAETRFPNMATLAPAMEFPGRPLVESAPTQGLNPGGYTSRVELADGEKVALKFVTTADGYMFHLYVFLDLPVGSSVGISIQTDSSGAPSGTLYGDEVLIEGDGNGPSWYYVLTHDILLATPEGTVLDGLTLSEMFETLTTGANPTLLSSGTTMWAVVRRVSGTPVAVSDGATLGSSVSGLYTSSAWTVDTTKRLAAIPDVSCYSDFSYSDGYYGGSDKLLLFNGNVVWSYGKRLLYLSSGTSPIGDTLLLGGDVTDMVVWGDNIVAATAGATGQGLQYVNTSMALTYSHTTFVAERLFRWGYYLYHSQGNVLYYSVEEGDTQAWYQLGYADTANGPYTVGPSGFNITGFAGLNDTDVLVATNEALYVVTAGDTVTGVRRWSSSKDTFGQNMINHQGEIFIPAGQSILQTDDTLSILPMGPDRDEGLPMHRAGNVTNLYSTNNWLYCIVSPSSSTPDAGDSLYAYNDQGWHHVASMPKWCRLRAVVYNASDKYLYGTDGRRVVRWYLPDEAVTPPRTEGAMFSPYSYIDSVPLFGSMRKFDKDYNSIYIEGDNLSTDSYVTIKWRTNESAAWSTLGSATADQTVLYWSDMATRPLSKKIYLRAELHTSDISKTPVLRAIAMEYQQMVRDRWQWNIPIIVSGDKWDLQIMADGSRNPYDGEAMVAHLVALRDSKQPFRFVDIDDQVYYAKVLSVSFAPYVPSEYSEADGARRTEWAVSLVLDQVLVGG